MLIKRFFRDEYMPQLVRDFGFLVQTIKDYVGEFELSFREDYFNLYRGYSGLAKAQLRELQEQYPNIPVKKFVHTL